MSVFLPDLPDVVDGLQWLAASLATRLADTGRVRLQLLPASGSGAARCENLRATAHRFTPLAGQYYPRKRTRNWIYPGGNVSV